MTASCFCDVKANNVGEAACVSCLSRNNNRNNNCVNVRNRIGSQGSGLQAVISYDKSVVHGGECRQARVGCKGGIVSGRRLVKNVVLLFLLNLFYPFSRQVFGGAGFCSRTNKIYPWRYMTLD